MATRRKGQPVSFEQGWTGIEGGFTGEKNHDISYIIMPEGTTGWVNQAGSIISDTLRCVGASQETTVKERVAFQTVLLISLYHLSECF